MADEPAIPTTPLPPPVVAPLPSPPAAPPAPPAPPPPPATDWKDDRIAKLTAQLSEKKRELDAANTKVGELAAGRNTGPSPTDVDRMVADRAAEMDFLRRCNVLAEAGRSAYEDFDQKAKDLRKIDTGATIAQNGMPVATKEYVNFIGAILEAGEIHAPRVLYTLAGDLQEAHRIMALPSIKQAAELAKIVNKEPPAEVSRAPKPITPIGAKGPPHTTIAASDPERGASLDIKTWMGRRTAEIEEQKKAGVRIR